MADERGPAAYPEPLDPIRQEGDPLGLWIPLHGVSIEKAMAVGAKGVGLVKGAQVNIIIDPEKGVYAELNQKTSDLTAVLNPHPKSVATLV